MTANQTIRLKAPAKINLGLEILGKRDDGYHEIRTVLSLIDITDDLTLTFMPHGSESTIDGVPEITPADNLIIKAINAFNHRTDIDQPIHARKVGS